MIKKVDRKKGMNNGRVVIEDICNYFQWALNKVLQSGKEHHSYTEEDGNLLVSLEVDFAYQLDELIREITGKKLSVAVDYERSVGEYDYVPDCHHTSRIKRPDISTLIA